MKILKLIFILLMFSLLSYSVNNFNKRVDSPLNYSSEDTTTVYSSSTQNFKLNKIPDEVYKMIHLKKISIQGMDCDYRETDSKGNDVTRCWAVREIAAAIINLKDLKELDLPVNNICELPKEICGLKKLRMINLTDNVCFSDLQPVTNIENLEEAYFYGCAITTIPEDIGKLKHLKILALSGNQLSKDMIARVKRLLPRCKIIF